MAGWSKENIISLIDLYRNSECLWKNRSKSYYNRIAREREYAKLEAFCKSIDPRATKDTARKKLSNLRTCFKKELKKHEISLQSHEAGSIEAEDIYQPSLWYFNDLMFLKGQDQENENIDTLDLTTVAERVNQMPLSPQTDSKDSINLDISYNQEEEENQSEHLEVEFEQHGLNRDEEFLPPRKKKRKRKLDSDDFTNSERQNLHTDDEFDVYGKYIAVRMRSLPKDQRIHAQKYISDIIYEAELGDLSRVAPFGSSFFKPA